MKFSTDPLPPILVAWAVFLLAAAPVAGAGDAPPQFTPGARSLGDPYLPTLGNGGYDVQHYDLSIHYNPATNGMAAVADLTIQATQNLSEFSLDLRGFPGATVAVDGVEAGVAKTGDKLIVTPSLGIEKNRVFHVMVAYAGRPTGIPMANGSGDLEGWVRSSDGGLTIGEPRGAMAWFPNNNHPSDKATFDLHLTVPSKHTALGNGELVSRIENGDGTATWNWHMGLPMATYLTTSSVGLFDFGTSTSSQAFGVSGGALTVYNAVESALSAAQKAAATAAIGRQEEIIRFIAGETGVPFPFESHGVVLHRSSLVRGALEEQTKTHIIGGEIDPVGLAHEVAHQWFGDCVSPATWQEVWFNEGWATWWMWYWSNRQNGDTNTLERVFEINYHASGQPWSHPPANLSGAGEMFSFFPSYARPALMLEAYRQIVGHATFFALQNAVLTEHAYGNIREAEFVALAKRVARDRSGFTDPYLARLDEFFQQWLHGQVRPSLTPTTFLEGLDPRLTVRRNGVGELELAWPQTKSLYVVERSEGVNGLVWTAVSSPVSSANGITRTTVPQLEGNGFYRLRRE